MNLCIFQTVLLFKRPCGAEQHPMTIDDTLTLYNRVQILTGGGGGFDFLMTGENNGKIEMWRREGGVEVGGDPWGRQQ